MFGRRKKKYSFSRSRRFGGSSTKSRGARLKNPRKIKRSEKRNRIFFVINIVLILAIAIACYFFLFSPFYTINTVEVRGVEAIAPDDILAVTDEVLSQKQFFFFSNTNIFRFSKSRLKNSLNEHFVFADITIYKKLPDTLILSITEKEAAAYWVTDSHRYLISKEGSVIKKSFSSHVPYKILQLQENEDSYTLPVVEDGFLHIHNAERTSVGLSEQVLTEDNIRFVKEIYETLARRNHGVIQKIEVPHKFPQTITFFMEGDWHIIFNLNDSANTQLNRLELLMREKIDSENISDLEYIDLSLGEKVFFKYK